MLRLTLFYVLVAACGDNRQGSTDAAADVAVDTRALDCTSACSSTQRCEGPSPTNIDPLTIIGGAEAHGLGWMAWAWDDPAYNADDTSFSLSLDGDYSSSADLTIYGKEVVEDPTYGLVHSAQPATIF